MKQQTQRALLRSTCRFAAIDATQYALQQCLYDHRRSKVWTAIRRADGVEVVIKWCSRSSALQTVQAYLALTGMDLRLAVGVFVFCVLAMMR